MFSIFFLSLRSPSPDVTHLDVQSRIETHQQISLFVFGKDLLQTLLEDTHLETIGQDHVSICRIGQCLHFQQSHLVQSSDEDVDGVPILSRATSEGIVELQSSLVVLDIVLVNVVVRSDTVAKLSGNDISWTFRAGSAREEHDTSSSVWESGLEETDSHAYGCPRATLSPLVVGYWPSILLQLLQDASQLEFALADGEQESSCAESGTSSSLGRLRRPASLGWHARSRSCASSEAKHVLDGLGSVLLCSSEDVGLGASLVAELMDLSHGTEGDETYQSIGWQETETDHEGFTETLEVVFIEAGVYNVEEDGWSRRGAREGVLNGGILGEELCGEIGVGDVSVVRREGIARHAKGADPQLGPHIDLTEARGRIEGRGASQ